MVLSGSIARLIRRITSRAGPRSVGKYAFLPRPTPCSLVQVPYILMAISMRLELIWHASRVLISFAIKEIGPDGGDHATIFVQNHLPFRTMRAMCGIVFFRPCRFQRCIEGIGVPVGCVITTHCFAGIGKRQHRVFVSATGPARCKERLFAPDVGSVSILGFARNGDIDPRCSGMFAEQLRGVDGPGERCVRTM